MANTVEKINSLILSATEIKQMTDWPDAMIEEWLTILRNLINIAQDVDIIDDREVIFDKKASQLIAVLNGELRRMQGYVNKHIRDAENISQLLYAW